MYDEEGYLVNGCDGGNHEYVYDYLIEMNGVSTDILYPYISGEEPDDKYKCWSFKKRFGVLKSYSRINKFSSNELSTDEENYLWD